MVWLNSFPTLVFKAWGLSVLHSSWERSLDGRHHAGLLHQRALPVVVFNATSISQLPSFPVSALSLPEGCTVIGPPLLLSCASALSCGFRLFSGFPPFIHTHTHTYIYIFAFLSTAFRFPGDTSFSSRFDFSQYGNFRRMEERREGRRKCTPPEFQWSVMAVQWKEGLLRSLRSILLGRPFGISVG